MNADQIAGVRELAKAGQIDILIGWMNSFPEFAYETRQIVTEIQIRKFCRRQHLTTKAGTLHCLDGRDEAAALWTILNGCSGQANGIAWTCRKVDQLRNIYLQF